MKGQDTGVTWVEAPQVASTRRRGGAHDLDTAWYYYDTHHARY